MLCCCCGFCFCDYSCLHLCAIILSWQGRVQYVLLLLDSAHWCSTFTESGHVQQKLSYFILYTIVLVFETFRESDGISEEVWQKTVTMARKANSHHVVFASLNFTFIARRMLGGWMIVVLAKRQRTLLTLLVASSWQHMYPLVPSGGDKCSIYSFTPKKNVGKCASALKFSCGTRQWGICVWAAASEYAKFSAALPKPACAAVRSPGCCQVCLWTDLTSLLSCLSRQGSKRAHSSGPYAGPSLAVWPPVSADWTGIQDFLFSFSSLA